VTISHSRPMIELRDLPTKGGRESVPVSRTLLNHPVSQPAKIRSLQTVSLTSVLTSNRTERGSSATKVRRSHEGDLISAVRRATEANPQA
jgi:hypothetical protein